MAKKSKKQEITLTYIEWVDSSSCGGSVWKRKEDVVEDIDLICKSIGFKVKENKDCVTIVAHTTPWQYSGDMTIPKCAIKKMKDIKFNA